MVNYIFDVSWEDDFRFSIIDLMEEEKIKNNDQTISQTEWITCYTLNWLQDCQIYYTLNIIDTPGFGDTRGIERDQKVVEQIRELFTLSGDQGIATLDGICFVTQAPLARLTAPHTYIIDSILSIFGRDITENIFGLITFADGKKPPVVDALKTADVPIVKTFAFNNSAIFEENKNIPSDSFSPMFWNMGKASFSSFFKYLTGKKSVSLQLTSEVLEERKQLETLVEGLRPQINEGLSVIETLRQETAILKKHECDIRENKDFTYTVNKTCQRKVDLQPGIHVTNCLICNRTCHENCRIADDAKKNKCSAMKNGTCTICPQYCSWQEHKNNSYKFEFYTEKVKSTYKELQARYNTAQSGASKQKQIVHEIRQQVMINEKSVQCMIEKMRVTINKISSIALKPNPLNSVQYIDLLIDAERREAKQGYRSRMQTLHKFRDNALLLQNVPDRNYKPFGDIAEYMGEKGKSETNTKGEGLKQKIINLFK
ncbi:hypothetical protein KUTeg_014917 [Tegillarca granosa]|uniref:AIG1-type G domain-containing protein n=1 Tax=Tegillarca granosa TaxID=220873 RepID=A0ABQ9ENM1_TEGGR|nr:hypothetical protein KUTeg_014917 [Tegillarca granosa]